MAHYVRLILILVGSLWLSACKSGDSNGPSLGRHKTMIVHTLADPTGMNPIVSVGATTDYIHQLIFDKLLALDFETLKLRPTVTDNLPDISGDKLTYTFKLKKGVTFSDGTPLTAKDVEFSFKAIMNPFVDSGPVRAELHNFVNCVAPDDYTAIFTLKESGPKNLDKLAINFFILPRHIYDKNKIAEGYSCEEGCQAIEDRDNVEPMALDKMKTFSIAFANENYQRSKGSVIGSGRYTFDNWVTGQYIRLIKNSNYWNSGSSHPFAMQGMDTIIYKTVNDLETAFIALKNGEIDFSNEFKPSQVSEKMKSPEFLEKFKVNTIPYPLYEYIGWNTHIKDQPHKIFFQDKRVRQALSHLINVEEIIDKVLYGTGVPISSMVYYERPEYNRDLGIIQFNEQKAKALLYQAGWEDIDGDGYLEKVVNGRPVRFEFKLFYRQGKKVRENIALIVQQTFKTVGIKVEPVSLDWSVMLEKLKRKELDAWIGAWVFDSNEQDFYQLFHSSQINNDGFNWTQYSNPKADKIMEAIHTEWNQEKRYELHREIQQIIYDDQPYTNLFGNTARIAYNNRVDTKYWYGQRPCFDIPQFTLQPKAPLEQ